MLRSMIKLRDVFPEIVYVLGWCHIKDKVKVTRKVP